MITKVRYHKRLLIVKRNEFSHLIRGDQKWIIIPFNPKNQHWKVSTGKDIEIKLKSVDARLKGIVKLCFIYNDPKLLIRQFPYLEIYPEAQNKEEALSILRHYLNKNCPVLCLNVELKLPIFKNKYIITGGPGFGKSTLMNELENLGYIVFHEAARHIIEDQKKSDKLLLPWLDRVKFDRAVIDMMKKDYGKHDGNAYAFYDRGFPDLLGWRKFQNIKTEDIIKWVYLYPYEKLVFFSPTWKAIFSSDEDRPYSYAEAAKINRFLAKAYTNLGYNIVYLPKSDIQSRVNFVLNKIEEYRN